MDTNILMSKNYMLLKYILYIYLITFKSESERERRGRRDSQERQQAEAGVIKHEPRGAWAISAGRFKQRLALMVKMCNSSHLEAKAGRS